MLHHVDLPTEKISSSTFRRQLIEFTFLLEKTSNELVDVRSGEKINSVSVAILVSCDKVIKTESGMIKRYLSSKKILLLFQ